MKKGIKNVVKVIGIAGSAMAITAGSILGVDAGISVYKNKKNNKKNKFKL